MKISQRVSATRMRESVDGRVRNEHGLSTWEFVVNAFILFGGRGEGGMFGFCTIWNREKILGTSR